MTMKTPPAAAALLLLVSLASCTYSNPGADEAAATPLPPFDTAANGSVLDNPSQPEAEEEFLAAVGVADEQAFRGAILEQGREACLRIESTAASDPAALVDALSQGEIPYAAPAITTLCPQFLPYLAESKSLPGD